MESFISSGNAIVDYLNLNKTAQDVGKFTFFNTFDISAEEAKKKAESDAKTASDLAGKTAGQSMQKYTYNAITQAIKQTLNIANETIKLIILELNGNGTLTLDCDAFLLYADRMNKEIYIQGLNHVIIGKMGDTYAIIGYVENPIKTTERTKDKVCTTFKLNQTNDKCALLPQIIKNIIFQCIKQHYDETNKEPAAMKQYYNPVREDITKEVVTEREADARAAAAEAAAEVKTTDQCDFKALLKSKIKNESNEYCKVTDPGLLERIQQNIDKNKVDVNVSGLNDLIKTRLDGLKKVKEEEEKDEEEEKERDDKTTSEKKEAQMIREANEMFVISQQVLSELSKGTTYSSKKFFKDYLKNAMVTEQEENEPEPDTTAITATSDTVGATAPDTGTAAPATDTTGAEGPVAAPAQAVAAAPVTSTEAAPATDTTGAEGPVAAPAQAVAEGAAAPATDTTGAEGAAAPAAPAAPAAVRVAVRAVAAATKMKGFVKLNPDYIKKKNPTGYELFGLDKRIGLITNSDINANTITYSDNIGSHNIVITDDTNYFIRKN